MKAQLTLIAALLLVLGLIWQSRHFDPTHDARCIRLTKNGHELCR